MTLKFLSCISLVLGLFVVPVKAGSLIEGVVLNSQTDQPVAGVIIRINASGRQIEIPVSTGTDGSFSFDPEKFFSADELDTWSVALTFSAKDFFERTQVSRTPDRGIFKFKDLKVQLAPNAGVWNLPDDLKQQLNAIKSANGKALFIVPYAISEEAKKRLPDNFMEILSFNIRRGIITHLQGLEVDEIPEDISILGLPFDIDKSNMEKMQVIGKALNALALVGGFGGTGQQEGDRPITELASHFTIIPKLDGFNPGTLYIDDRLVGKPLNVTTLYKGLDELWGRNTVLAISALEVKQGLVQKDRKKLILARSYLVAERSEIGTDKNGYLTKINKLIQFIEMTVTRLDAGGSQ